jgi:competence protein ComEC
MGLFALKKYKYSYFIITISISLLIGTQFLREKEIYVKKASTPVPENQYLTVRGRLLQYPEIRNDCSVILLETESMEHQKQKRRIDFNLRVKVMGNLNHFYRGDHIEISLKLNRNRFNKNFFTNPMEDYVFNKKIHFNGYCKSKELVFLTKPTLLPWRIFGRWRNNIRESLEQKYSDTKKVIDRKGVFLLAILLGDRGQLSETQKEQLLSSGVFHLLAISGAHIGIIALFSILILKKFKVAFRNRYIITGIILVIFLILSGFKISAERAVLMALLIFIARILYLDVYIYNIISFTGLILLVRNPSEFLDAGFILTFTLTAAIVIGRRIILPWLKGITTYLKELISANLSASLISIPLSLFFFKRYCFASFIAGLLLLPLVAVITGLGVLLIPVAPLSTFLSNIILLVIDIPLWLFFFIVDLFSKLNFLTIYRASPPLYLVILVPTLFYLITKCRSAFQKLTAIILTLTLIIGMSLQLFFYNPKNLQAFFLDVGQGDCQVVVFPGGDGLLIDGGGTYYSDFQVGKKIVLSFLLQKRIRIKWIALSHYHPDHSRGIIETINTLDPEELWISSEAKQDFFYKWLMATIDGKSIKVRSIYTPFTKTIKDCQIEVLHPRRFIIGNHSKNNHSQVLKISSKNHSILFTGDIEEKAEDFLINSNCSGLKSTVIKVPHHGSKTSSTPEFLDCVQPKIAIISCSRNNRFNFPHQQVIQNYRKKNIAILLTANRGGVQLIFFPKGIKVETSR